MRAELVIEHSGDPNPTRIPIVGAGRAPPGSPAIRVDPPNVEFGGVPTGGSQTRTVLVMSEGDELVRVGRARVRPEEAHGFEVVDDGCGLEQVAPGDVCTIGVRFGGVSGGPMEAELVVPSNAAGAPHVVPLFGRILAPDLATELEVGNPDFDEEQVSIPVTITIVNQGEAEAPLFLVSISASPPPTRIEFEGWPESPLDDGVVLGVSEPTAATPGENVVSITGQLYFSSEPQAREVQMTVLAGVCSDGGGRWCYRNELYQDNNVAIERFLLPASKREPEPPIPLPPTPTDASPSPKIVE